MDEEVAALLTTIPKGWRVKIDWQNDEYPCVEVTLSRDFGRDSHVGHGADADLPTALAAAVQDALVSAKQD